MEMLRLEEAVRARWRLNGAGDILMLALWISQHRRASTFANILQVYTKAKDEQIINSWPISSSPSRWKQSNKIPINPWVDCRWLIFAHSKSYLRTFNDHTKEFLKWLMKQIYFDCESFACNQLICVCTLYSWIVRSCKWERLLNSIKFYSTSQKHWIMSQLKLPPESSTSQLINQL